MNPVAVLLGTALVIGMISIAYASRATARACAGLSPWRSLLAMTGTAAAAFTLVWASSLLHHPTP